ncbi:MAG: cell division protein ZapA [Nitrospinae bacterium]|nr:cell division protein ZapA [Nitrospinota bacterium]
MNQTITLHGKEYRIRSPFEPEYTEKLARYCDSLMKSIGDASASKDYLDVSVLTLLQVAHNYFRQLELSKGPNPEVEAEIARMIAMLDEAEKEAAAHRGEARHASDK